MSSADPRPQPSGFLVTETAARHPDLPAIASLREKRDASLPSGACPAPITTYRDLERLTTSTAQALLASGIQSGERVALRMLPEATYPVLLMSLIRAGAVAVPLSTRIPDAAVPDLLAGIGCRHLIAPRGLRLEEAPKAGSNGTVSQGGAEGRAPIALLNPDDLIRAGRTAPVGGLPSFDATGDATIVFTSGSTGMPKAALHSYANHWYSAAGSNRNIPCGPGDRWLLSLPLWHVGGLGILFRAFLGGGAVAVPETDAPLADAVRALGATHLSLVATQLYRLLREPGGAEHLAGLKAVLLGGGPIPPALVEEALRRRVPIFTSYGCTEMSSQVTTTAPGDPAGLLLTSGRPLPFRSVGIAADGEILVGGETLFRGYVEGDRLDEARDADGWFHTGDLGSLDGRGALIVAGRRDAMFVSGGENIHPEEIERELCRHPGILEAVVVPVEHAEFGARPVAFLRTASGDLPPAAALREFLLRSLPGFKVPDRYLGMPGAAEGIKPRRRELQELARGR